MLDRRLFLLSAAALAACKRAEPAIPITAKRMTITMDDFAQGFDTGLSLETRHNNILDAFDAVAHKAAGFVTGSFVESEWGQRVVNDWLSRGHSIGNHTWSHPYANATPTRDYIADIQKNKAYLDGVVGANGYFRFPFLDDGKDRGQQVELFDGLKTMGLTNTPVTIDTVDWFTSSRMEARLRGSSNADLSPYRDYYVQMCVNLANYWEKVGRILGNIGLPHLTLMHHNVLNGYFLKDVLLALKADGWYFEDAKTALSLEAYHDLPPEPTHGRNWLTLESRSRGLSLPPFPEEFMGFGRKKMDALGL